ncbi:MAG: hypothetical protein LLG00_13975 [Planctomycetaceae bacterium]|nr:hypothetical protein [Planctomycetaceae bacterium]
MHRLRPIFRRLTVVAITLVTWLAVDAAVFAQKFQQPKAGEATTGTGPYVMAYGLLIVGIALGLAVVCTSSNRRDRAHPEGFVKSAVIEEQEKRAQAKK